MCKLGQVAAISRAMQGRGSSPNLSQRRCVIYGADAHATPQTYLAPHPRSLATLPSLGVAAWSR